MNKSTKGPKEGLPGESSRPTPNDSGDTPPCKEVYLHFDLNAGVAGDMLLAALIDSGVPRAPIDEALAAIGFKEKAFSLERVNRGSVSSLHLTISSEAKATGIACKTYSEGREVIHRAGLNKTLKEKATQTLLSLAQAEAAVHGTSVDEIHFHEVSGADTLIDIVGVLAAVMWLNPTKISASPVCVGGGVVETRHGSLPVPAPATILLLKHIPIMGGRDQKHELATPTGASLIKNLTHQFGNLPAMHVNGIGYGAGTIDLQGKPNVVRALWGTPFPAHTYQDNRDNCKDGATDEPLVEMRANIDDMSPELLGHLCEEFLKMGALDTWITPIIMKKGRPGTEIAVLLRDRDRNAFIKKFFTHSTSFGVRWNPVQRRRIFRKNEQIETQWGMIDIKAGYLDGKVMTVSPEYESCKRIAREFGIPLKKVYRETSAAWVAKNCPPKC